VYTPEGHFVIYSPIGTRAQGLGYTDRGAETFLDECYRNLVGQWWMFVGDAASGGCPIGYQFHGGP
jgi:hypothetical protein